MNRWMKAVVITCCIAIPLRAEAQVPVESSPDHAKLLQSADPRLAANKRFVYDFWREVLEAGHMDLAPKYLAESYIQHNPNVPSGRAAFISNASSRVRGSRTSTSPQNRPSANASIIAFTSSPSG